MPTSATVKLIMLWAGLLPCLAWAQSSIQGTLINEEDNTPAPFVQVLLYPYQSAQIADYALSDEKGEFELQLPAANGIFSLKTRSLAFEPMDKDIVLANEDATAIALTLKLKPKAHELATATVTDKRPPMLVRADTIIYDVSHWSDAFDESLEAVLKKMPGMEVLPDGELKIKGKRVAKVLIDGEEIGDGGAALLTRSLSPGRVAAIEVRLNEQNEKLRESLLSQNDFVTLDIKLRDDFDQRLFGQLSATAGAQEELRLGGLAKLFSLNHNLKFQLLGERDAFGDQAISLSNIKNLGAEAYAKIFELPADFEQLRSNPVFNEELYGLREYTAMDLASAGLTGKATLSPDLDLYLGSYNAFAMQQQQNRFAQSTLDNSQATVAADQLRYSKVASSKNKVELTFDREGWKARYNFNFVWNDQLLRQQQRFLDLEQFNFADATESREVYHNFFVEHRLSEAAGLQANVLYSAVRGNVLRSLQYSSERYEEFFQPQGLNAADLEQLLPQREAKTVGRLYLQTTHKFGITQTGFRAMRESLRGQKLLQRGGEAVPMGPAGWQNRQFRQWLPFLGHQFAVGAFRSDAQIAYAFNQFNSFSPEEGLKLRPLLEYKAKLSFDLDEDNNITFNLDRSTAYFPLWQLLPGWELQGFQSIAIPGQYGLEPQPQRNMELSATSFSLGQYGIAIELAGIMGKAFNSPALRLSPQGIIEVAFHQLPSDYRVGVAKVAKVFQNLPLQAKLEGSIIQNRAANLSPTGGAVTVGTLIRALDLRAFTTFQDQNFNFESRIKQTDFRFVNPDGSRQNGQQIWNAYLTYRHKLSSDQLQLSTTVRANLFTGTQSAALYLIDTELQYRFKSGRFVLSAYNLLDSSEFLLQEINPVFFTDIQRSVFGRFLKIGCTWDIN